jgi:hypothetical protein
MDLTAWATVALVIVTMVLAWVTGWYLKKQNDRAKEAHSTELFLQLRLRAISPEHAARRCRVIALLMHLEGRKLNERTLNTGDLEFSPDITLLLNDYQWIGRLVKDGMLEADYAMATYGRDLLLLYPKLKPYIQNEQNLRNHSTLWQDVSGLYKKFKQLDKDALTESEIDRLLKIELRWLRPSTILKPEGGMREEIDVDRLLQDVAAQYNAPQILGDTSSAFDSSVQSPFSQAVAPQDKRFSIP